MEHKKVNRVWATWKSKIRNALKQQPQNHVILVKPIDSNNSNDDKAYIEPEHLKTFRTIWRLVDLMAYVAGVSATKEVDINARMVFTTSMICCAYPSLFYTMFVVWPSIPVLLEVLCIFGVLLPATSKYILILKDLKYILSMNSFFEKILISHPNGRRADDLANQMKYAYSKVKLFIAVSVLCFVVFALYPMYAYAYENRLVPIMRLEFPFVDQTNEKGYLIAASIMLLFGVLGVIGSVAFDLTVLTLLLEYESLVTLLVHDLDDYNEILQKTDTYSAQYRDSFLLNICMKSGDINSFLRCFEKTFTDNIFYSVLALYASLICSVYAVLNADKTIYAPLASIVILTCEHNESRLRLDPKCSHVSITILARVNRVWATWKSKIRNALKQQPQNHVILVKPIDSNNSNDDKAYIEPEHLKTFRTIWRLVDLMAYVAGVSAIKVVDINARMVFTTLMVFLAYPSLFYTMFVVWPSIPVLLEVLCIFGVLLPGTLKYILILKDLKYILSMNSFFEKILISHPNGRRADVLAKEMKYAYSKVKLFIAVSVLCFVVFALYPMYAYAYENRLVPIMHMEFPFVDQTNEKGYLIGSSILLLYGVLGVIGSVAFDLTVLTLLLEYQSLVTLLVHDLDDYNEILQKTDTYSAQYRDSFLLNICMKSGDINSFLRCFEKMFTDNIFYSVLTLYASLICSVYAVLNNGWISGYGFCLFCFVQLYVQCILGTFVDIQNEKINQAFYFTPWYEYPVKVQKLLMLLLHASSFNAIQLRIGPYAPLNVETGLMITKGVFSYYTTMNNLT